MVAAAYTLIRVLAFDFRGHWLIAPILAVVLQIGVWADYMMLRARLSPIFEWLTGSPLPDSVRGAIFWLLISWIFFAGIYAISRTIAASLTAPRIEWDMRDPIVADWRDGMIGNEPVVGHMVRLVVAIRNNPHKKSIDGLITDAHCKAEFFEYPSDKAVLTIDACRWSDNKKPRADDFPKNEVPKFRSEFEVRNIPANNKPTLIDFAIRSFDAPEIYGFAGQDQNENKYPRWRNEKHILPKQQYWVRLTIDAVGIEPTSKWLVVRNDGNFLPVVTSIEQEFERWGNLGLA